MDSGLEFLLSLNELEFTYENGYWYKIEVFRIVATRERPHGIRYTLTFHDNANNRIFGMDNAHSIKSGKKFQGRLVEYDHLHKNKADKGTPYKFISAEKLMQDFFDKINHILGDIIK